MSFREQLCTTLTLLNRLYRCMSGYKARASSYNTVEHVNMATGVQTGESHVDSNPAGILTQWTVAAVCVTRQNMGTVYSSTHNR